jgi:hypothetical protein
VRTTLLRRQSGVRSCNEITYLVDLTLRAGDWADATPSALLDPFQLLSCDGWYARSRLDETDFAWSLGLVGEDQAAKLALLTGDLRRPPSATGDGKRITSGFSYLGVEPAIAWVTACSDHLYPVMRQSIESFDRRWAQVRPALGRDRFHYVSLGPGDGKKDGVILRDLGRANSRLSYVAVDMSGEMLRLGVGDLIRQLKLSRSTHPARAAGLLRAGQRGRPPPPGS